MSFESFYGGRKGASIVIVKRFDGINIPQEEDHYIYRVAYLAVTPDKSYYLCTVNSDGSIDFIEKDSSNYNTYSWELTLLDGSSVPVQSIDGAIIGNRNLWQVQARGMVQCFELGGSSTNEVNYGEYVIIDTPDKNNPENGKVFCRGWDYDNGYAGAEYKGQIVGPQGPAPELSLEHYETIDELTEYVNKFTGEYQVDTFNDLVPGVEGTLTTFNDKIKWITASLKDQWGNVERCVIGFKIPYLVLDFEANSIDPYDPNYRQGSVGNWSYHNLIAKDTGADGFDTNTNAWKHPFFEKWQVKVPPGIHGDNSTNIEVVHTKTKPLNMNDNKKVKYYRNKAMADTDYVGELEDSVNVLLENVTGRTPEGELIWVDTLYMNDETYDPVYSPTANWCKIKIDETENIYYVHEEDCYMDIIRYRETIFDDFKVGQFRYYYIGYKNDIKRITLSEDGILTVFYSAVATPQNLEHAIKWIEQNGISIDKHGTVKVIYNTKHEEPEGSGTYINDYQDFYQVLKCFKDTHSIQFGDDGTVTVIYNTVHEEDDPDNPGQKIQVNDTDKYPKLVDWITDVSLTQEGKFEVLFNNDTRGDSGKYTTTLEWIDWIVVNEDGTIDFYLNTDHETPVYTSFLRLKIIDDIEIQTIDTTLPETEQLEGTGDQKIHITYNVEDEMNPGQKEKQIVGNPLNYIIETTVSVPNDSYPDVPYSHFLVYYSDPVLRQSMRNKWVRYPSQKYPGKVWTEWVDLGDIRGSQNGIHIITNVENMDDIKNIPPEQLKSDAAGWNVTYTPVGSTTTELLAFDYNTREWYPIGSIDNSLINPATVVAVSQDNGSHMPDPADVSNLLNNGLWFATETHRYAY